MTILKEQDLEKTFRRGDKHLSMINVVAEVPSMDMEEIYGQSVGGRSSSSDRSVSFHELARFMATCLVNRCYFIILSENEQPRN